MSQIVENWADVEGIVEDVETDAGALLVRLRVMDARAVDGFPNLLRDDIGRTISVRVPTAAPPLDATGDVASMRAGTMIRCRVRRAGVDGYFAQDGSLRSG